MAHTAATRALFADLGRLHPLDFLARFAPIHRRWHLFPRSGRPLGFLTFHKDVIIAFRASLATVGAQNLLPPPWADPNFPYDPNLDTINDLATFSRDIEGWHNDIHMTFPLADFAEPSRNIYLRPFWALHLLIDQKFDACLTRNGLTYAAMPAPLHRTV